jgi:Homeodomain
LPFSFAENPHIDLFSTRPQPKKKRKSRTAFTNHQIFELEKRFLYQKYLSPADRDEIAAGLGLSNAQVIIDSFPGQDFVRRCVTAFAPSSLVSLGRLSCQISIQSMCGWPRGDEKTKLAAEKPLDKSLRIESGPFASCLV